MASKTKQTHIDELVALSNRMYEFLEIMCDDPVVQAYYEERGVITRLSFLDKAPSLAESAKSAMDEFDTKIGELQDKGLAGPYDIGLSYVEVEPSLPGEPDEPF